MNEIINAIIEDLGNVIAKKDIQYYFFGKPSNISNDMLLKGVVMIEPVGTSVESVTTGITDEDTNELTIWVVKQLRGLPNNAQIETGAQFMVRLIENKTNGNLETNTIRYVIRRNLRQYGLMQAGFSVEYDVDEVDNDGAVTAKINLSVLAHTNQSII